MDQLITWAAMVISFAFGPLQSALNLWNPDFAIVWYDPSAKTASACIETMFQLSPPDPPLKVSETVKPRIWSMVTSRFKRISAPLVLPFGQLWLWFTLLAACLVPSVNRTVMLRLSFQPRRSSSEVQNVNEIFVTCFPVGQPTPGCALMSRDGLLPVNLWKPNEATGTLTALPKPNA